MASVATATDPVLVFIEDFDGFATGGQPSSIVEIRDTPWDYGEVVDRRYAIAHGGNRHRLIAPRLRNLDLRFTAEPHRSARVAPILVLHFRTGPGYGYRLYHWLRPDWGRVDLWRDREDGRERLTSTNVPKTAFPQPAPLRFQLLVDEGGIRLIRNGKEVFAFRDADPLLEAGAVAIDSNTNTRSAVAPMFFDDVELRSGDLGLKDKIKTVYQRNFFVPGEMVAAHVHPPFTVAVDEIHDTGLEHVWRDVPANGRVHRVRLSIGFPKMDMVRGRVAGRRMAAVNPYVQLEDSRGQAFFRQQVFHGILGSPWPGHKSAPAQHIRILRQHDSPPPPGPEIRHVAPADCSGAKEAAVYLTHLPADFRIVAGWEHWQDQDHVAAAGPIEATFTKRGEVLHVGPPIEKGELSFILRSPVSAGILARIREGNRYYEDCVRFQEANHFFLEGEDVTFRLDCQAGIDARLDASVEWALHDAWLRATGPHGTAELSAPRTGLWSRADRKLRWQSPPFRPKVRQPGVYWLRTRVGSTERWRAFSVVPKEHRPGNTAASAAGLPHLYGNFYPMQQWLKDIHHYVSSAPDARNVDWKEATQAYNLNAWRAHQRELTELDGCQGWWNPRLEGLKASGVPRLPDKRLWRRAAARPDCIAAFRRSEHYRVHPGDRVWDDPKSNDDLRWKQLVSHHLKAWCDYWSVQFARYDRQFRAAIDKTFPGLDTASYGPRLISSYQYGNLYCGKYYGWDWKRRTDARDRLMTEWQVETYAHEFGRPSMTYAPSLALTKMSIPSLKLRWEMYGAMGGVEDHRLKMGRPPFGLNLPTRDLIANHTVELALGPWYFDGTFKRGSGTHYAPHVGQFIQFQLFGMLDGLRVDLESAAVRPVRSPAFVRSYEAAELDPSWARGRINNGAAEAPAYSYVQSRMAGLAGGFFVDISKVELVSPDHTDLLVLPSMRGATPEQIKAIRRLFGNGVSLLCYDDCTGLEDLFGVRRLREPAAMEWVAVQDEKSVLAGVPSDRLRDRPRHKGELHYELDGASEILIGTNANRERVAPLMTIRRTGKAGAVFFTAGSTEIGRHREQLDDTGHEGEVTSDLIRYSLRAALRAIAHPVVTVTPPATALAFERRDGSLYIVVLESSFPHSSRVSAPSDILVTIHSSRPKTLHLDCAQQLLEMAPQRDHRVVKLSLRPDQVAPIVVKGWKD